MLFIIRSLVSVIVIVVIVFAVTNFSGPIQKTAGDVLGVQIAPKQTEALPERLTGDMQESLKDAQQSTMQLSVEDVTSFLARTQKIVADYQVAQKEIQKTVDTFFEERKTDEK